MPAIGRNGNESRNPHFRPLRLLLAVAIMLLAACAPKDPLDLTIKAPTLGAFNDWWSDRRPDFPEDTAREFERAFQLLNTSTARLRPMRLEDPNDPFAKRLHRLSVRSVIISAYHERNEQLQREMLQEMESLSTLLKLPPEAANDPVQRRRESLARSSQKQIDAITQEVERIKARIKELSPSRTP